MIAERVRDGIVSRVPSYRAPILVKPDTGSTNDDAKGLLREGSAHGTLVIADAQTKGRGRSANAWFSPRGENLYLSLVIVPQQQAPSPASFALVVGLEVARAIEERGCRGARLKWPNDVQLGGKKVAGILMEGTMRGPAIVGLVVGIGVNVATRAFPGNLAAIATSLALEGAADLDRARLAAAVAANVLTAWDTYRDAALAPFMDELRARDALAGRLVRIDAVEGRAEGIDADGRLVVVDGDGRHAVASGHVELV